MKNLITRPSHISLLQNLLSLTMFLVHVRTSTSLSFLKHPIRTCHQLKMTPSSLSSSISLLEHVNLNVPDHSRVPFYTNVLGLGLDPRRAHNVFQKKEDKTFWVNCGPSQFHLPHGDVPQVIPGSIGLMYEDMNSLIERLEKYKGEYEFYDYEVMDDDGRCVKILDGYGNVLFARQCQDDVDDVEEGASLVMKQPLISSDADVGDNLVGDSSEFSGEFRQLYAMESTHCKGISYVEFKCPRKTAKLIAEFYECVMNAVVDIVDDGNDMVCIVAIGKIDKDGRAAQNIIFRESDDKIPDYDGHHIAVYIGESNDEFENIYKNCEQAGIVWVNPRFSDKAKSISGARQWNQFRFKDILELETGKTIFTLEHEVRSVRHSAWPGHERA